MLPQDPEGPNPVADSGWGGTADDGACCFSLLLGLCLCLAVRAVFGTERRPLRRQDWRPVDPARVAPLRRSTAPERPRPVRAFLSGLIPSATATACLVAMAPFAYGMLAALWPPFSGTPNPHGWQLDFALVVLLGLLGFLAAAMAAPRVAPCIRRLARRVLRRLRAGPAPA